MKKAIKIIAIIAVGFVIGVTEENIRYGIIAHEAKKGDEESKNILNELEQVGAGIEYLLK